MSAVLFGLSLHCDGRMALLATVMLSLLSTNTGITNKWKPSPNNPKADSHSPTGDVVIKYPQGAFIIAYCDERTARHLYCIYNIRSRTTYRGLLLISTLPLMGGVICLANAIIPLQTGFAASYVVTNICRLDRSSPAP
jgi:hypothetical protein